MTFWEYAPGLFLNLYHVTHITFDVQSIDTEVRVFMTSGGFGIPLRLEKATELRRILGSASMAPFSDADTR